MKASIRLVCVLTFLIAILGFPLFVQAQEGEFPPPPDYNVLIVGWDGAERSVFYDMLHGGQLPNLQRLTRTVWDNTTTSGATVTKPGWVQLLSGYSAERTGIYSNYRYRPLRKRWSIFSRYEKHFGRHNVHTFFIAGKSAHVGGLCVKDGDPLGQPWCTAKRHIDLYRNALGDNDAVGRYASRFLRERAKEPFLGFMHFRSPDWEGHHYNGGSPEYIAGLRSDDYWLGELWTILEEKGWAERTLLYVVTDHGFNIGEHHHRKAPNGWLATNDPVVSRAGDRLDLTPTILSGYGIPITRVGKIPALDGTPLW